MKFSDIFADTNGKASSKRVSAFICIISGLVIGFVSLFTKSGAEYMWPPLITGGAMLGVTIGEKKTVSQDEK